MFYSFRYHYNACENGHIMVAMSAVSEIKQCYSLNYDIQPNKMAEIEVLEIEIITVIKLFKSLQCSPVSVYQNMGETLDINAF